MPSDVSGTLLQLRGASPVRRAAFLAGLAVISALLSNFLAELDGFTIWATPPLPGIYFAVVLTVGCLLWSSRSWWGGAAIFVSATAAWIAAVRTADFVHGSMMQAVKEAVNVDVVPGTVHYLLAVSGAIGGLVGSALTVSAFCLVSRETRAFAHWGRTIMVGTLAGILLESWQGGQAAWPIYTGSLLPLYLVWQPAVAASIVYGLHPRVRSVD